MDLNAMQFSIKKGVASEVSYNAIVGKTGQKAFRSTKATNDRPPVFTPVILAMDNLLLGRTKALYGESRVYVEVSPEAGKLPKYAYYDANTETLSGDSPTTGLLALLLYMITDEFCSSVAEETRQAFENIMETYNSGLSVNRNEYSILCSCFYFDTMDMKIEFNSGDVPFEQIQQASRTGEMVELDIVVQTTPEFMRIDYERVAHREKVPVDSQPDTFMADCKDGKYELGYNWGTEQQDKITAPDMLDRYILTEPFRKIVKVAHSRLQKVLERLDMGKTGKDAIENDFVNTILVGKPGTGKTVLAEALSSALGLPIYTVPVTKHSEEDVFSGMTKAVAGGFSFMATPFLDAFQNGGIVVVEEFNLADPGVIQGAIGQAIVPPFLMLKDGYEPVYRHPLCIVVLTMNTGTQGSREPNEALVSRAPLTLVMEDPDKKVFTDILKNKGASTKVANNIHEAYMKILAHLEKNASEDMMLSVTLRHCIEAVSLINAGFDIKTALNDTMVATLAIKDIEMSKEVRDTVIEPLAISA
jgi:hypothetical protein